MKSWTTVEVNKLKELAKTHNVREISVILDRSINSIQKKMSKEKISALKIDREWTVEEISLLEKMALSGASSLEITEKINKSNEAIRKKARKLGLTLKRNDRFWSEEEERKLLQLSKTKTITELASIFNRSKHSLRHKIRALNGSFVKKTKPWTKKEEIELIKLRKKGLSKVEISKKLGRSSVAISDKLRYLSARGAVSLGYISRWTEEEVTILKSLADENKRINAKEAENRINRTRDAIRHKIKLLGYSSYQSFSFWTKNEVKFLRNNYLTMPIEEISKKLNRSESAIRSKILNLGLSLAEKTIRSSDLTEEDKGKIRELGKTMTPNQIVAKLKISKKIIYRFCKAEGIKVRSCKKWTDEEIKILKEANGKLTVFEVREKLGNRTNYAIAKKAQEIKIVFKKNEEGVWSNRNIDYLKRKYKEETEDDLAIKLRKEVREVRIKARELGLKLKTHERTSEPWSDIEVEIIKEKGVLGKYSAEEMTVFVDRSIESIEKKMLELGLTLAPSNELFLNENRIKKLRADLKKEAGHRYQRKILKAIELHGNLVPIKEISKIVNLDKETLEREIEDYFSNRFNCLKESVSNNKNLSFVRTRKGKARGFFEEKDKGDSKMKMIDVHLLMNNL